MSKHIHLHVGQTQMKIFGSILIIIASIVAAYFYEEHQKNKQKCLKELLCFIEYIKNQISFFTMPLQEIYTHAKKDNTVIQKLISCEKVSEYGKELEDELSFCFETLGKGFKTEQIKTLEYTEKQISFKIDEQEKHLPQKVKVFRAMSIFVGCCSVILFV